MNLKEINELYEESVFQIRLRMAIHLASVPGVSFNQALQQADVFVLRLMEDEANDLRTKFS